VLKDFLPAEFAKIKSRQDALQTTFSGRLDIFYPPILTKASFSTPTGGFDIYLRLRPVFGPDTLGHLIIETMVAGAPDDARRPKKRAPSMKRLRAEMHYQLCGVVQSGSVAGKEATANTEEVDIGCPESCCAFETELA